MASHTNNDSVLFIPCETTRKFKKKPTTLKSIKKFADISLLSEKDISIMLDSTTINPLYMIKLNISKNLLDKELSTELANFLNGYVLQDDHRMLDVSALSFVITPRLGTISPSSTKATSLLKICNYGFVERIEISSVYSLDFKNNNKLLQDVLNLKKEVKDMFVEFFYKDNMTQDHFLLESNNMDIIAEVFAKKEQKQIRYIENNALELNTENQNLGLCLTKQEIEYILANKKSRISDAELMMFSQLNSEHCRHKHFNATCIIDNIEKQKTMFQLIKETYKNVSHLNIKSAYKDNAAVINGVKIKKFGLANNGVYSESQSENNTTSMIIKVETHNHPTGVSPYEGAATGVGGEIRDEGAVGIGSQPKCGVSGYIVSNLNIPGNQKTWENSVPEYFQTNPKLASPLDIMIEGPLGACNYSNEFGRPNIMGFFRTVMIPSPNSDTYWGYHKPLMLAGGMGNILDFHIQKKQPEQNDLVIVLGGSGLLIGLGGSCQSSKELNSSEKNDMLDYQSVQRDNAEIERRCQEVINRCTEMNENNIILIIHDVGAGGLSNAIPELVNDSHKGAVIDLRKILVDDDSMSPMEIWCNESQERYVLCINRKNLKVFDEVCKRERCPYSVVGTITNNRALRVYDSKNDHYCIDVEMDFLFNHAPKLICNDELDACKINQKTKFDTSLESYFPQEYSKESISFKIAECIDRVLEFPAVASKMFLITIGDRSVGGLVTQAQLVGKYQTPIGNVGVVKTCFNSLMGEAVSIGERPVLALIDSKSSVGMAFGESLTNMLCAYVESLSHISVSANWMACVSHNGQLTSLYEAVEHLSLEVMSKLDICIPVGKDSMSMKAEWEHNNSSLKVVSPVTGVITAYSAVKNVNKTLTPELKFTKCSQTILVLVDLGYGKRRMGGSALSQVFGNINEEPPCFENIPLIKNFNDSINKLRNTDSFSAKCDSVILAYHDKSDGGLITTILEMCFASRTGISLDLVDILPQTNIDKVNLEDVIKTLFNEELGVVLQIEEQDYDHMLGVFGEFSYPTEHIYKIAKVNSSEKDPNFEININQTCLYKNSIYDLLLKWSSTSFSIQSIRDASDRYSIEENNLLKDENYKGLFYKTTYHINSSIPKTITKCPKVYIIREQGTNGHVEMAYSFYRAGFEPHDIHMSDVKDGKVDFNHADLRGVAFCGGFSFGDVIGAGKGWELSLKKGNSKSYQALIKLMRSKDKFVLGVCNGCQLLSKFSECTCFSENPNDNFVSCWPNFIKNKSGRFEARTAMVHIPSESNSIFLSSMKGSYLPIVVAHGEGNAQFKSENCLEKIKANKMIALQYIKDVDKTNSLYQNYSEEYPINPNGSVHGIAAVSSKDGRILAMMPHPERTIFTHNMPYYPHDFKAKKSEIIEDSPWMEMFYNVRRWVG